MNDPSHILQLSISLWYTMLLTAEFCFIRSIRAIRSTITTPSWWNAVRVIALKLIRTTEVCWKSMQNKTFPVSNIIAQHQVLVYSVEMVVAHSTVTALAVTFWYHTHRMQAGLEPKKGNKDNFYIKQSLFRPITGRGFKEKKAPRFWDNRHMNVRL